MNTKEYAEKIASTIFEETSPETYETMDFVDIYESKTASIRDPRVLRVYWAMPEGGEYVRVATVARSVDNRVSFEFLEGTDAEKVGNVLKERMIRL